MTAIISRDAVSPDLRTTLRALKLGQMLATLPDRLTLARQQKMTHADFLELVLADEVTRREAKSASLRARAAGLDAGMRLDTWTSRRRPLRPPALERAGQPAVPRRPARRADPRPGRRRQDPPGLRAGAHRHPPPPHRAHGPAAKLFKRLKAARLDNTLDYEMRRLASVELLILDDFALQPLDATQTADFYQLCVERHQRASTIVTSNRTAEEWLSMMADPLLAQSAVDRLVSTAHELVMKGTQTVFS